MSFEAPEPATRIPSRICFEALNPSVHRPATTLPCQAEFYGKEAPPIPMCVGDYQFDTLIAINLLKAAPRPPH